MLSHYLSHLRIITVQPRTLSQQNYNARASIQFTRAKHVTPSFQTLMVAFSNVLTVDADFTLKQTSINTCYAPNTIIYVQYAGKYSLININFANTNLVMSQKRTSVVKNLDVPNHLKVLKMYVRMFDTFMP